MFRIDRTGVLIATLTVLGGYLFEPLVGLFVLFSCVLTAIVDNLRQR